MYKLRDSVSKTSCFGKNTYVLVLSICKSLYIGPNWYILRIGIQSRRKGLNFGGGGLLMYLSGSANVY